MFRCGTGTDFRRVICVGVRTCIAFTGEPVFLDRPLDPFVYPGSFIIRQPVQDIAYRNGLQPGDMDIDEMRVQAACPGRIARQAAFCADLVILTDRPGIRVLHAL